MKNANATMVDYSAGRVIRWERDIMTRKDFIAKVAGDSDTIADDALISDFLQDREVESTVNVICSVVEALQENEFLSQRMKANRLERLLIRIPLGQNQFFLSLAQSAREFPPHFRVTVANFMPDFAIAQVYSQQNLYVKPYKEQASNNSSLKIESKYSVSVETQRDTVLLLSHPDRQGSNLNLLKNTQLNPIVVETYEKLTVLLTESTEICGCAIDRSFLSLLDKKKQIELFESLAKYSSFIAIRVQATQLHISRECAIKIIKNVRRLNTLVPSDAISFQTEGSIREAELSFFENSAGLLQSHESASFNFRDLTQSESQLLVAALRSRERAESNHLKIGSGPITVQFLPGGLSGAKLLTVDSGETETLVAKITTKEYALDEMLRFRAFIQNWNSELKPECHFHGNVAVILFGLVRSDSDPSTPAETLENRLNQVWNNHWVDRSSIANEIVFLKMAFKRVSDNLRELNMSTPNQQVTHQSFVNPPGTHLNALVREGAVWGLDGSAKKGLTIASNLVKKMGCVSVVHGDIHLQNILIRGESQIHLIDFAASNLGHPALDLVRFELALYLRQVRHFEDEGRCVEFQRLFSIERARIECLRDSFPDFFSCDFNDACASGMTNARDSAIKVLRKYGGGILDYLAVKLLIAWQHLGIIGSNTGLARGIILAISDKLVNDDASE